MTAQSVKEFGPVTALNATSKDAVAQLVKAWESKNAQRAVRGAGLGLMAVSLAACGGSDSTTTTTPVTPAPVTPVSAALTIGVDSVVGTSANDTISGARVDGVQTWNSADSIAAGAGTDTLTAVIAANVTPGVGAITGVENLVVTAVVGAATVAFGDGTDTFISGVTNITNLGSTAALTFNQVGDLAAVTINNTGINATTVQFTTAALAGASDSVTLNLSGVGAGDITIGSAANADGDYETLVVNNSGAASDLGAGSVDHGVPTFGTDATSVVVNATAALDFGTTARFASANSVDASGSTAAVELILADDATAGTNARTVTGGSGADVLDVSYLVEANVGVLTVNGGSGNDTINLGGFADDTMVISGGAGTDTLIVTSDILLAESARISGFETLHTTADQQMRDFLNNDGIVNFRLTDGDADITQVAAGAVSLQIGGINGAGTPSLARLIDGANDAITIATVAAVTTTSPTSLAIDNEETVTINSGDGALALGAAGNAADFAAADMTSLTVVGDNSVTLNDVSSASVATVNVAGLTAAASFSASFAASTVAMTVTANSAATGYTGTLTVTTGSGNDVISGTANNDVISAGAGNDSITAGDGDDAITLGTGSDTIVFAATAALNGTDTINGLGGGALVGGGDVLNFAAFLSGGSVEVNGGASGAIVAFAAANDNDVNITGKVALFGTAAAIADGGNDADITTTNEVLAAVVDEIQGANNAFSLTSGGKAIVLIGNTTAATDVTYVVFVDDSLGATRGTVEADDMTIVAVTGANFDLDTLTTANFTFA